MSRPDHAAVTVTPRPSDLAGARATVGHGGPHRGAAAVRVEAAIRHPGQAGPRPAQGPRESPPGPLELICTVTGSMFPESGAVTVL
jgi:hypothetical protein